MNKDDITLKDSAWLFVGFVKSFMEIYIVLQVCSPSKGCLNDLLSKLQALLLQQQTFLEKCETWMEFLVQTEEKLTVEISGNFQSLMEQQRAHEVRHTKAN